MADELDKALIQLRVAILKYIGGPELSKRVSSTLGDADPGTTYSVARTHIQMRGRKDNSRRSQRIDEGRPVDGGSDLPEELGSSSESSRDDAEVASPPEIGTRSAVTAFAAVAAAILLALIGWFIW